MRRPLASVIAAALSISSAAHAATPPPRRDVVQRCEQTASRAACDPRTGYIAGPSGPCRPSDLRCIEREWVERGRVRYYPDLGICARDHEDGGTIVPCPPGVGPGSGSGGSGSRPPTSGSTRGGTPRTGTPRTGTPPRSTPRRPSAPRVATPTTEEAARTCPRLPTPRLYRNPDHEGVTGMATWLWADRHRTYSSTAAIRGQRVTCTAVPEQWTWYPGDGGSHSRGQPGSPPPRHAAEHVYERKGAYTQRLVVRWRLQTNYGTTTTSRETSRSYRVVEIRGELVE